MAALPDDIHASITQLSADGDRLSEEGQYEEARALFHEALALLPEPAHDWAAHLWLLVAIGDTYFLGHDFRNARECFMDAVKWHDDARGNPFIRMRLGQCLYELGEYPEASSWLAGAYLLEGAALFEGEDAKFLHFVKPQLRPPPGGWPPGW